MTAKRILAALAAACCWLGAASAGDLEKLDFMTGIWRWESPAGPVEEWWMPAAGNTKVAAFRWAQGESVVTIELLVISAEQDGVFLRFKHFDADYTPWEKDGPNVYRLASAGDNRAAFRLVSENPKAPKAIVYWRSDNTLTFRGTSDPDVASHEDDLVIVFDKVE